MATEGPGPEGEMGGADLNASSWADEMDEEDEREASLEKEKFETVKAKIEAETEKARKRAERFGAEFSAPSVELILDPEELRLYYKITQPEKAAPKAGRGAQHRSQRIDGGLLDGPSEIRDRDYTKKLLEKVAEAQRAARARAERFGVEYVEPKLNVILSREEYRKYMSATGGRNPLMLETAPVAGIDTTSEEEKVRIAARADRFKAMAGIKEGDTEAVNAVAAAAAAAAELQQREEEFQREKAALEARAAKFGLELHANPYGEDLFKPTCLRRELPTAEQLAEMAAEADAQGNPAPTVEVTIDTLHVFGVDRLSTDEILRYFGDYSPSYVLWLDDSSANLVFGDAANARRALFSLGQAIRLPASAPVEAGMTDGDQAGAPTASEGARIDPVWRRGPNYEKAGYEYAVLIRQAVSTDAKKGKPVKSKRLWLEDGGGRPRGRGGGYSGDYREERMGGGASRARERARKPRPEKAANPPKNPDGTPVLDLRSTIGKATKERRGRKQRHNPYGMQVDDDEPVAMMETEEAVRIMNAPPAPASAASNQLTEQEQMMLENVTAAADSMAE